MNETKTISDIEMDLMLRPDAHILSSEEMDLVLKRLETQTAISNGVLQATIGTAMWVNETSKNVARYG